MSRLVDRGAIAAAYVGIGMAVTIVVSFMLFIPIEWIIWVLALPSGLLIGYYANQRSDRRAGPWGRILVNGLFAGFVTGLTAAVLLLAIKALFFYADNGFRDPGLGGPISCRGRGRVRLPALPGRRARPGVRGRRRDRRRLVHAVLLERAVRQRGDDPGPDHARRRRRRCALRRVPAEGRGAAGAGAGAPAGSGSGPVTG